MKRMNFNSQGRLVSIDEGVVDYPSKKEKPIKHLKTSEELEFLKAGDSKLEEIFDNSYWSLNSEKTKFGPLKFSNGKSQEDIVKEIVNLIKEGNKVIFLKGVCGTGKSAIALNVARKLGKSCIVVPVKGLQRQYEEQYMGNKYLVKSNGTKMKIAMITGRENHDSIIKPGASCADPFLPDTIKLSERNIDQIREFYDENPCIANKLGLPVLKNLKRISIAPANPYWSPIIPADVELHQLNDAKKLKYKAIGGRDLIFYHRKPGCSYYDQYLGYIYADVIIFNSAKYKSELDLGRKPETDVDIIDEADEFLDSLANQLELNLNRLASSLKNINTDSISANESIHGIIDLLDLEQKNKRALGVNEDQIFKLDETKIGKILSMLLKNPELESEIVIDELNYANKALEAARSFCPYSEDVYLTFRKDGEDIYANLVTVNLSRKFSEIVDKNKAVIFMSGTLHSESVLKNIFGIKDYKIVEGEGLNQGSIEIKRTGKEMDCRYSNFQAKKFTRKDYLSSLSECIKKADKPILVHVNSFEDLPSGLEVDSYELGEVMPREKLKQLQGDDKTGKLISMFRAKMTDSLFTTKCSRGVDFPGDICRSVIFTKYPNPNVNETFWKILQKTYPNYYWDFYKDKARREFVQRIYRAVRSKDDHVYVLSPDSRVLDAVRELQLQSCK